MITKMTQNIAGLEECFCERYTDDVSLEAARKLGGKAMISQIFVLRANQCNIPDTR